MNPDAYCLWFLHAQSIFTRVLVSNLPGVRPGASSFPLKLGRFVFLGILHALGFYWNLLSLGYVGIPMSLKVYDGMRSKGASAGFLVGPRVREAIIGRQKLLFGRAVCASIADCLDGREFGWFKGDVPSWFDAMRECAGRWRAVYSTRRRDPEMDFGFEASFWLSGDWTLCVTTCEHKELSDLFNELSGFGAYPAWDNTDRPDGVAEAEWDARCDEWREVLRHEPLRLAFNDVPFLGFSEEYLPDPMKRAKKAAFNVFNEAWAGYVGVDPKDGVREALRCMDAWREMDEGEKEGRVSGCLGRLPDLLGFINNG